MSYAEQCDVCEKPIKKLTEQHRGLCGKCHHKCLRVPRADFRAIDLGGCAKCLNTDYSCRFKHITEAHDDLRERQRLLTKKSITQVLNELGR